MYIINQAMKRAFIRLYVFIVFNSVICFTYCVNRHLKSFHIPYIFCFSAYFFCYCVSVGRNKTGQLNSPFDKFCRYVVNNIISAQGFTAKPLNNKLAIFAILIQKINNACSSIHAHRRSFNSVFIAIIASSIAVCRHRNNGI